LEEWAAVGLASLRGWRNLSKHSAPISLRRTSVRYWQAILPVLAAAGISAPAAARPGVYVAIAHTDEVIVLIRATGDIPRVHKTTRASQFAYYTAPGFSFEGVPIRLTETEFEIDCENGASRRIRASAYRDIGDRVGGETYSETWAPIPATMAAMRRLDCEGIGPGDSFYDNLHSAVQGYGRLLRDESAG
jgi:hypothetical protein